MSKFATALVISVFSMLTGCGGDKGSGFIGHWVGQAAASRSFLDIKFSEGIYHIDVSYPDPVTGNKLEVNKLEAVAASETVLLIHAPLGDVSMRLEGDTVALEDQVFKKSK